MDLHTNRTAWDKTLSEEETPTYPSLHENITCDVLIIGGGMGGALSAREMAHRGMNVVLVEKGKIGQGSSVANTGLLQYTNDKMMTSCINTFGEQNGVLFYRLCQQAMQYLIEIAPTLPIDAQLIPRSSLYYASNPEDVPALQEEYANLKRFGFEAEYWDEEEIAKRFSFRKAGGLYTHGDAEVNPYRFIHALMADAMNHGAQLYEGVEITNHVADDIGVTCYAGDIEIRARTVIYATGYATQEMKKERGAFLETTYAIMTSPVESWDGWHEQSMVWETTRPYLYMRTTADNRIVVGGLDEPFTDPEWRDVRMVKQSQKLLEEVQTLFPDVGELSIDYAWAAVFGSSRDGLPYIGAHPDYPHCYFVEGYGGNGTVYSAIAAQLLADTISGIHRQELDLFDLTRTTKPSPATVDDIIV